MSTQIYTSYVSDIGLLGSVEVEIRDGQTGTILILFTPTGITEDEPGNYAFFASVDDNTDQVYKAYWRDNSGDRAYMELIGGTRTIVQDIPGASSGGIATVFGPPGTSVVVS